MSKSTTHVSIPSSERETSINWTPDTNEAHVYTANPVIMRKFDKLIEKYPDTYSLVREEYWKGNRTCFYKIANAKYISFRGPIGMSEEQKEKLAARLKQSRCLNNNVQNA